MRQRVRRDLGEHQQSKARWKAAFQGQPVAAAGEERQVGIIQAKSRKRVLREKDWPSFTERGQVR